MKLKIQCNFCSRFLLIPIPEEKKDVMEIVCINCKSIIKFRIPEKKKEDPVEKLKNMFGMKDFNPFSDIFGGFKK